MPRELGVPKYFKYKECEPGEVLVKKGEFIGVTEGRFGDQYNFIEVDDGQHVVLNQNGQIAWRIRSGHIGEGDVVSIEYGGMETLEKGAMAGKEAHNFKFLVYDDSELPEKYHGRAKPAQVAKEEVTVSDDMDQLD